MVDREGGEGEIEEEEERDVERNIERGWVVDREEGKRREGKVTARGREG